MKLTLQGKTLLDALQSVSKLPTRHPAQPILAYTCLTVATDHVEVLAHGLGVSGRVIIPFVSVDDAGRVAIDQNVLIGFLSTIKNLGEVTLEIVEGVVHVVSGDSEADIKTYPHETVQEFAELVGDTWYTGSSTLLSDVIKRVSFACAVSDIRPELASVFLSIKQGFLVAAATDSFYLAETRVPCELEEGTVLLPNKYTPHVLHCLGNSGKVDCVATEGSCQFQSGNYTLIIRTITGSYPQYEQIIPKEFPITIETTRDEVRTALRTVQPFADPQFPKIMLKPNTDESMCVCETDYNDRGRGKSSFRALIVGDIEENLMIRVNADNIMKIMNVLSVDRVVFSCIDPMRPIMVTSPDDIYFRALLMPVGR